MISILLATAILFFAVGLAIRILCFFLQCILRLIICFCDLIEKHSEET